MAKLVPSARLRRELDEVLAGLGEHDDPVEAVARVGARLIMQQALEDEVTEFPVSAASALMAAARSTAMARSRER